MYHLALTSHRLASQMIIGFMEGVLARTMKAHLAMHRQRVTMADVFGARDLFEYVLEDVKRLLYIMVCAAGALVRRQHAVFPKQSVL